jgi:RIO kinase 1
MWQCLALQGELHIIDVSQSVDLDHPKALEFLREDCKHINQFFRAKGAWDFFCNVQRVF